MQLYQVACVYLQQHDQVHADVVRSRRRQLRSVSSRSPKTRVEPHPRRVRLPSPSGSSLVSSQVTSLWYVGRSASPPSLKLNSKTYGTLEKTSLEFVRLSLPVKFHQQFISPRYHHVPVKYCDVTTYDVIHCSFVGKRRQWWLNLTN